MEAVNWSTYDSYKDSGAEWLGAIPDKWTTLRAKFIWRESSSISSDGTESLLSVSQKNGVIPREEDSRSEDLAGYRHVRKGDLVSNIMLAWMGALGVSKYEGIVSPAYSVYRLIAEADTGYLDYLYRTSSYLAEFARRSTGVVPSRWRLYTENFGEVLTLLPSSREQRAIARFLDEKCAKVDEAVRIKEEQIALLRERRQILIQEAVTRGLNPDAPMKDSGIDWVGEIPAHWNVRRLKHIARIRYGLGQPPREHDGGLPLLRATNVERGKINRNGLVFVDPAGVPKERGAFLREGEILVVRSGAYTGDSAIVPPEFDGAVAGYDMVVTPHAVKPAFLSFALLSPYVLYEQLYLLRMRAAQPHLNKEELSETLVMLPSGEEQTEIANVIEENCGKIDEGIAIKKSQIAALKEYKSTLINAAVTGKIKVA